MSIDDVTIEALNRIDPNLCSAIKTLRPENIEFGECLKLRKYLFSGTIGGTIELLSKNYQYNSYTDKIDSSSYWKSIRNFYGDRFTDYVGWLVCIGDYDYFSCFKGSLSDIYANYAIEVHGESKMLMICPSENPKKKILSVKEKDTAALNLALAFGEKVVQQATWTYVESYRCGFVSLASYDCTETDEYVEIPIFPIFVPMKNGEKAPIGAYLTTYKRTHIQFYGKEEELDNARMIVLAERHRQRRKRILHLCLKIAGGALLAGAVIALVLNFLL